MTIGLQLCYVNCIESSCLIIQFNVAIATCMYKQRFYSVLSAYMHIAIGQGELIGGLQDYAACYSTKLKSKVLTTLLRIFALLLMRIMGICLENNGQISLELGNGIMGKIKRITYQGLISCLIQSPCA